MIAGPAAAEPLPCATASGCGTHGWGWPTCAPADLHVRVCWGVWGCSACCCSATAVLPHDACQSRQRHIEHSGRSSASPSPPRPPPLQVAKRFYLLFQQHTNEARCRDHGLFGTVGYSQVLQATPKLALALPDQRTERTRKMVSWRGGTGQGRAGQLLPTCLIASQRCTCNERACSSSALPGMHAAPWHSVCYAAVWSTLSHHHTRACPPPAPPATPTGAATHPHGVSHNVEHS